MLPPMAEMWPEWERILEGKFDPDLEVEKMSWQNDTEEVKELMQQVRSYMINLDFR